MLSNRLMTFGIFRSMLYTVVHSKTHTLHTCRYTHYNSPSYVIHRSMSMPCGNRRYVQIIMYKWICKFFLHVSRIIVFIPIAVNNLYGTDSICINALHNISVSQLLSTILPIWCEELLE